MGKSMKSKYMKRKRMVGEKFDEQNFRVIILEFYNNWPKIYFFAPKLHKILIVY